MAPQNIEVGKIGEEVACTFLKRKGFTIIDRNVRRPWGEIDIVAVKRNIVHMVEVKTSVSVKDRFSREMQSPLERATTLKMARVCRTAELYMHERNDLREYQIDALSILLDTVSRKARCQFFEQAIG